jgi:UDP-3-O-acyl-N-acetylglucosamine deacetylase
MKVLKPFKVVEGDRRIGIYPPVNFACAATWISRTCWSASGSGNGGQPETFRHLPARPRILFRTRYRPLKAMGLIRGGSLENAIVLTDDGVMNGPCAFPMNLAVIRP